MLIIWGERFKSGGTDDVTVRFGNKFKTIKIYDPTKGVMETERYKNCDVVKLSLSNHPVILEIF